MRRSLPPLLAVVLLLLGACGGRQATNSSGTTAGTSAVTADTTSIRARSSQGVLDAVIKADEPGCSAAVGVEGKVVWTGVRGIANLGIGAAIATGTVFDIGSVSKQFTATAVLLLAEAGKLGLDDALSQYVPGLPAWAATVTVAQLMHHTSGIPDYTGLLQDEGYKDSDRTTQAQALQALAAVPELGFTPGARFEYSKLQLFAACRDCPLGIRETAARVPEGGDLPTARSGHGDGSGCEGSKRGRVV